MMLMVIMMSISNRKANNNTVVYPRDLAKEVNQLVTRTHMHVLQQLYTIPANLSSVSLPPLPVQFPVIP